MSKNDITGINKAGSTEDDDELLEALLGDLDLPGDKDIDRSGPPIYNIDEETDEHAKEDLSVGDTESEDEYYNANPQVSYDRPTLKTDKKKRISKNALDSLFKDLDKTMAGGTPSSDRPIFEEIVAPEKKVADLPELADTDYPLDYDKEDGPNMTDDKENDKRNMGEGDSINKNEEEASKEIPFTEDTIEDRIEEQSKEQIKTADKKENDEVNLTDLEWDEGDDFSIDSINDADKEDIDRTVVNDELGDIDSTINDEQVAMPNINLDDILLENKEDDTIKSTKLDDFDTYIENYEHKNAEDTLPMNETTSDEKEDLTKESSSDAYDIESEFTGLTSLQDEDKYEEVKLDENKYDEVHAEEEAETGEAISPKEIDLTKEQDAEGDAQDNEIYKSEVSSVEDVQSLIESIPEPSLKEESTKSDAGEDYSIEVPSITEATEDIPLDIPSAEEELLHKDSEVSKQEAPKEKKEEYTHITTREIIADTKEEEKKEDEQTNIEFKPEEIALITKNISKLPDKLAAITTDTIVNEKLSDRDMKELTDILINNPKASLVKNILEDKLNISISIPKEKPVQHVYENEEYKSGSNSVVRLVASFIFIALLGMSVWFFVLKPYLDTENKYEQGITDIQKGTNHYAEAIKKFMDAKGNSDGDRKWYILYAKAFINENNPKAYYYAHNFLIGNEAINKQFLQKYDKTQKEKQNNNTEESKRNNPGQEINISPTVSNPIEHGILHYIPTDREALLLLANVYTQKAIWAAHNKDIINNNINWEDVDYYLKQAVDRAYQPLIEINQLDIEVLDKEARTYILWASLVSGIKPLLKEQKLDLAENNYNKILSEDAGSQKGLYGLLLLYLNKEELARNADEKAKLVKVINSIYSAIEKTELDIVDEEVFSTLAYHFIKQNKNKKGKNLLNRVIRNGKIYPKAYYYLALSYAKDRDLEKSLESYVKGIFAFYYLKVGKEKFFKRISGLSNFEQSNIMHQEMLRAINIVRKDTDPLNSRLQSLIFNNLGENMLKRTFGLSSNIEDEKKEKKYLMQMAKKNFILSLEKQSTNYVPWKNLGNLSYFKTMQETKNFIENLPKEQISQYSLLPKLQELTAFKKAKYYYLNALNLMIQQKPQDYNGGIELWKSLVSAVKVNKVDADLFYKMGFIFYKENKYKKASAIWHSIKTIPSMKFNPSLNFALANSYLRIGDHGEARRHYKNAIEFYETLAYNYRNNPNPYSKKQNRVFSKLAKTHNNLGVSYHIMSEELNNYKFKEYARLHYFQAREYASKLNNSALIAKELWNQNMLNSNYIALQNVNISLKERLKAKSRGKMEAIRLPNPLDYMLIEDIEYILK